MCKKRVFPQKKSLKINKHVGMLILHFRVGTISVFSIDNTLCCYSFKNWNFGFYHMFRRIQLFIVKAHCRWMYKTDFSSEFSIMFSLTVDCEPRKFLGQNGDTCQKCPIGTKPKKYAVNLRYISFWQTILMLWMITADKK